MDYQASQMLLTVRDLQDFVENAVEYKTGYTFDVFHNAYEGPYLSVRVWVADSGDQDKEIELRINSPIPNIARINHDYFSEWLLERLIKIEIHEVCEFFKVHGQKFYDPHKPIEPDHD